MRSVCLKWSKAQVRWSNEEENKGGGQRCRFTPSIGLFFFSRFVFVCFVCRLLKSDEPGLHRHAAHKPPRRWCQPEKCLKTEKKTRRSGNQREEEEDEEETVSKTLMVFFFVRFFVFVHSSLTTTTYRHDVVTAACVPNIVSVLSVRVENEEENEKNREQRKKRAQSFFFFLCLLSLTKTREKNSGFRSFFSYLVFSSLFFHPRLSTHSLQT